MKMTDYEKIHCIKSITAERIKEFGWVRGSFERKGKYCLVGMIRCVVLDYESEWMAECGEMEMTAEEFELYLAVLKNICRKAGIDTAGRPANDLSVELQKFNDNKCRTVADILTLLH